jgi:hypothetical protein
MAELCVIRAVVTLVVIFGTYMARGKAGKTRHYLY